jgi:hypothetical protein
MTNIYVFRSDDRFKELTTKVASLFDMLDTVLHNKGYLYKGKWRNDRESGGNVFIFEVDRRKGKRKNLITLRPQKSSLIVEVYWNKDNKKYYELKSEADLSDKLLLEIAEMYDMIV